MYVVNIYGNEGDFMTGAIYHFFTLPTTDKFLQKQ